MRFTITKYEKQYNFTVNSICQLCGQNIKDKSYIIKSINRYFGTYKYSEETNEWRDNVLLDGELFGRKYFSVIYISGISSLYSQISLGKQALLFKYIKELMQNFNCQKELEQISFHVDKIYNNINPIINLLGNISLTYKDAELWDIIQKSDVITTSGGSIENLSEFEVLKIFLNILKENNKFAPENYLVILENLDHLLTVKEYKSLIKTMKQINKDTNIKFIITTSLDGYVEIDNELIEELTVFNDVIFEFPSLEHLSKFVNDNYPIYKEFSEKEVNSHLYSIIQQIGKENFLTPIEDCVICKLINKTLAIENPLQSLENKALLAFLGE